MNEQLKNVMEMTAQTVGKDLLSALMQEVRLMSDVWVKLSQKKQDDVIDRIRNRVEANVSKCEAGLFEALSLRESKRLGEFMHELAEQEDQPNTAEA